MLGQRRRNVLPYGALSNRLVCHVVCLLRICVVLVLDEVAA
jgi:hypothetical protein